MKIIVYDDNPDFGGHQIMACHGAEALSADSSIDLICMVNPANEKLVSHLGKTNIPVCSTEEKRPVARPDLMLFIQGNTTQSAKGIKAARHAGIKCISYLALAHSMADMGALLGVLRDLMHQHNLNLPDRFITISDCMKQKLIARGCTRPVAVVPNGINIPTKSRNHQDPSAPSSCTLGLAGRMEFKQKRQNFIVDTFRNHPEPLQDCRILFAGNGPDENALRNMASAQDNISFLPWQQDMDAFYNQIDLLVIPSRYEGVPLVMLEALARGIPVVGSAVDGMKELLPEKWTFNPGDAKSFTQTVSHVRSTWKNDIDSLQQKILTDHSLDAFKANFLRAVCGH